jgi:hypothetical protein
LSGLGADPALGPPIRKRAEVRVLDDGDACGQFLPRGAGKAAFEIEFPGEFAPADPLATAPEVGRFQHFCDSARK